MLCLPHDVFCANQAVDGQLIFTRVFEILFNGKLLYWMNIMVSSFHVFSFADVPLCSKLETGRIVPQSELFQMINNHLNMAKPQLVTVRSAIWRQSPTRVSSTDAALPTYYELNTHSLTRSSSTLSAFRQTKHDDRKYSQSHRQKYQLSSRFLSVFLIPNTHLRSYVSWRAKSAYVLRQRRGGMLAAFNSGTIAVWNTCAKANSSPVFEFTGVHLSPATCVALSSVTDIHGIRRAV